MCVMITFRDVPTIQDPLVVTIHLACRQIFRDGAFWKTIEPIFPDSSMHGGPLGENDGSFRATLDIRAPTDGRQLGRPAAVQLGGEARPRMNLERQQRGFVLRERKLFTLLAIGWVILYLIVIELALLARTWF
ncbi:hypothetical protein PGT21_023961 [Puccinia graminis f. sp. tritici]|uniref:Uncharacterized protein n=1 Tax=Puccinia graminis f. sp. tritici TaxID=56615 RepID=A0A5B0M0E2_PUCGR|nr:hypothetical protein PGT21_023961 [Puccinia graminis f. sp. tritici]